MHITAWPLWIIVIAFLLAIVVIWLGGMRLSGYADEVATRTGLGHAFVGALLLGGVTSLPEAATTISASAIGNAPLAVNNIFGGIALQVVVLAIADWVARGRALSSRIEDDTVLLQATLLILVLVVAVMGVLLQDRLLYGFGGWALGLFAGSMVAFLLIHRQHAQVGWRPDGAPEDAASMLPSAPSQRHAGSDMTTAGLACALGASAVVILAGGYVLARTADVLAEHSGLGASFMGAVVVAFATSLPEVSTTLGAVRQGSYAMAYGNIFGANILDLSIIFAADVVYPGGPVLNEVGLFSAVAGLLGIALTTVFLVGLLRRRRRVTAGLGHDSAAVLLLYVAGLAMLFTLR
jgi:cation:H+ antiporter